MHMLINAQSVATVALAELAELAVLLETAVLTK
jgi:hypothetical protein